ncbi:histidine phosphatase superfamily [Mortierella sp. GBAus27b]|nr:histidine phosphatase superfamily [Mortierella sp. GBAus27b]
MVAQSRQIQLPSHRPWLVLALPSFALVLAIALLGLAADANPTTLRADDKCSQWNPGFTPAGLVDQTQEQIEQFWKSVSPASLPREEIEPSSRPKQDSGIPLNWIRQHLGTKSPYPHETRHKGPLADTPEGYELVQLHLTVRHGTRYPSSSKAAGYQKLTQRLKLFAPPDFEWLRRWRSEELYPMDRGNLLAAKGDSDLYQIGRRFAVRYKDLLDRYPYSANTYNLQSSGKSRCSQSAYAFSLGFFEGRHSTDPRTTETNEIDDRPPIQPIDIATIPVGIDKEMAVKYACPRWLESVKDSPSVVREALSYKRQFLPRIAEQLSAIFSLNDGLVSVNITTKDVETIYGICSFEVALYDNDQTWCQLLRQGIKDATAGSSEDQRSIFVNLEISGDLDDYYSYGPGVPFNRHLGCVLGTSLVNSIEKVLGPTTVKPTTSGRYSDDDASQRFRGLFKFGHTETLLFFSSFLGLYNQLGVPLKGNMTLEQLEQREFWTSKISPFAANMAFEVYRPKTEDIFKRRLVTEGEATEASAHTPIGLIRLMVNEEPMVIPGCGSAYFCEWATLKELLRQAGAGCDFDGCCTSLNSFKGAEEDTTAPVCFPVEPIAV